MFSQKVRTLRIWALLLHDYQRIISLIFYDYSIRIEGGKLKPAFGFGLLGLNEGLCCSGIKFIVITLLHSTAINIIYNKKSLVTSIDKERTSLKSNDYIFMLIPVNNFIVAYRTTVAGQSKRNQESCVQE